MISYYFLIANILTFFLYAIDKIKAKINAWRISEATLLLFTFIGGSIGALLALVILRHKKNKKIFVFISFISLVIHGFLYYNFK